MAQPGPCSWCCSTSPSRWGDVIDPITILAACTAVWNGIKQASEFANEAEGIFAQLSKYCGLADQLEQHIQTAKNTKPKKPSLFGKLDSGNDTQEAFNAFEAEYKLREHEAQIREMFLYGAWADLPHGYGSMDGYRKFCEMRRQIRQERIRLKQEQENMQAEFWYKIKLYGGGTAIIVVGLLLMWMMIEFAFNMGK